MDYEGVTLDREGGIATLTLDRPQQLNAISLPMMKSIGEAVQEVARDDSLKVLIITGAGRSFCAGLDVSTFKEVGKMTTRELDDT
ncbi:MAG TPA: hypothetical protein DIT43_03245, partial [Dehalococcoidia bacterium]|nr:hypothetical protein [Dehalococcoidia bacterium]